MVTLQAIVVLMQIIMHEHLQQLLRLLLLVSVTASRDRIAHAIPIRPSTELESL